MNLGATLTECASHSAPYVDCIVAWRKVSALLRGVDVDKPQILVVFAVLLGIFATLFGLVALLLW